MRRTGYLQSLFAAAALAMPCSLPGNPGEPYPATAFQNANVQREVSGGQALRLDLVSAMPEPPVFALLAAGLALGLARGKGVRRPVRRRRG
jgi:hypothetical protein